MWLRDSENSKSRVTPFQNELQSRAEMTAAMGLALFDRVPNALKGARSVRRGSRQVLLDLALPTLRALGQGQTGTQAHSVHPA